jgi:hypothetical protein
MPISVDPRFRGGDELSMDGGRQKPGGLFRLSGFADRIGTASWFAACGETLTEAEIDDARLWLRALGIGIEAMEGVATWQDAARLAQSPAWSRAWWDAEEKERRRLYADTVGAFGETALLGALSRVTEAATRVLHGAAAVAAGRAGVADPSLTRVAAGAAGQACYQAALALAAGADGHHPFAAKYRLFLAGRWPLGVVGDRGFVF